MTDTLLMTSTENGIAILVLFIFSAVGALIGKLSLRWLNPINSNKLCQAVTAANTGLAALILTGPNQNWRAYLIAGGWGLGAGWKNTVERFAVTQIIPVGQDAELMGFYLFSSQVIVWLPTLIFTSMNEAGVSQRVSITILIAFFMSGIGCLSLMDKYDDIVSAAGRTEITGETSTAEVIANEEEPIE
jgi:MFS-type transporter involved in bile tolerance (Atg22 family)